MMVHTMRHSRVCHCRDRVRPVSFGNYKYTLNPIKNRPLSTLTSLIQPIIQSHQSVVQTKEDQQIHSQVTLQAPAY
jgi:hypothetical protein